LLTRSPLAIRIFSKRSAFFFEKKKQKTFVCLVGRAGGWTLLSRYGLSPALVQTARPPPLCDPTDAMQKAVNP
jgi:hypothetical protein